MRGIVNDTLYNDRTVPTVIDLTDQRAVAAHLTRLHTDHHRISHSRQ